MGCNSLSDVRGEGEGYSEVPELGEKVNGSIFHGDWKRREGTG